MFIPNRAALALGLSALVLAGCGGSSSDSEAVAGPDPDTGGGKPTELPGDPDPVIVPAPQADFTPEFIVGPYLQAPIP